MGIASLGGILSGAGDVHAPDAGQVGQDFQSMIGAYLNEMPAIYQNEATYQPAYTALSNANTSATRSSSVGDVANLSPQIMQILRSYNPQQTRLLDTLTNQAQQQLGLNGALDPATQRMLQQNVRAGQAARGMGYGPGDAAVEGYYETSTAEERRRANQALAGQVATQTANTYGDPFRYLLGIGPANNAPSITSTGNMLSFMGIPYQGRLSAASDTARNVTGLYETMDNNQTKFMSSMAEMGAGI